MKILVSGGTGLYWEPLIESITYDNFRPYVVS
jgi:hypothetical protein